MDLLALVNKDSVGILRGFLLRELTYPEQRNYILHGLPANPNAQSDSESASSAQPCSPESYVLPGCAQASSEHRMDAQSRQEAPNLLWEWWEQGGAAAVCIMQ